MSHEKKLPVTYDNRYRHKLNTPEKSLIGFENVPCDFIFFSDLSGCLNNTLLLRHTYSHRIPGAFH